MNVIWKSLLAWVLVLTIVGCQRPKQHFPTSGPTGPPTLNAIPVAEEEALALGYEVESALGNQDFEAVAALFDLDRFQQPINWERVNGKLAAPSIPPGDVANRTSDQDIKHSIAQGLDTLLSAAVPESFSLIGVRDRGSGRRLVFRMIAREECVTYVEFSYARFRDGIRLTDAYFHPVGHFMSDSYRSDKAADVRLEIQNLKRGKILREKLTAARAGDVQEFVKIYQEMPWDEESRRRCLIPLLMISPSLSDDDFAMAVGEARKRFPTDVQVNLSLAWAFESRESGLEALEPIDRVNEAIGGDPYLRAWKAGFQANTGKDDDAKALIAEVLTDSPLDWDTVQLSLWNCLRRKDYAQATQVMDVVIRDFEKGAIDQFELDGYAEFTQSVAFQEWKAAQEGK